MRGVVVKGLGEGAFYVAKYNPKFLNVLGEEFFPGTLNLRTDEIVRLKDGITVSPPNGFEEVRCYPCTINGEVKGYIVVSTVRKHGDEIIEIMAPINLREHYNLKDGDEVTCESG